MYLSPPAGKLNGKFSLIKLLERIRITLNESVQVWADLLGMSVQDYQFFLIGQRELSILTLFNLANHLELSLETLMKGQVDFHALAARFSGNEIYVPERYSRAALSRRRTSLNLLNATEEFLGWEARVAALRHLQVSEAVFQNPDDRINILFNTDLCSFLSKTYGSDDLFFTMGAYAVVSNQNTPFARVMSQQRSVKELFQFFAEQMLSGHWELNHNYRLMKLTDTSCSIESVVSEDLSSGLGIKAPGSAWTCQTKAGVSACIPGFMGLPFAHVRETACIHRGDPHCIHDIDFELAAYRMKVRRQQLTA